MLNSIVLLPFFFAIRIDYAITWFRYNVQPPIHVFISPNKFSIFRYFFPQFLFPLFAVELFAQVLRCLLVAFSVCTVPAPFTTFSHIALWMCVVQSVDTMPTTAQRNLVIRFFVQLLCCCRLAHVLPFSFTKFRLFPFFSFSIVDRKIHFSHSPQLKFAFRCCRCSAVTIPSAPVSFPFPFVVVVDDFREFASLFYFLSFYFFFIFFNVTAEQHATGCTTTRMRIQFSSL